MKIGNWPPGYLDPAEAPAGLMKMINDTKTQLAELKEELKVWQEETERRRVEAWIIYHDTYGWPDDVNYRRRMERLKNR